MDHLSLPRLPFSCLIMVFAVLLSHAVEPVLAQPVTLYFEDFQDDVVEMRDDVEILISD